VSKACVITIFLILAIVAQAFAQTPYLERTITISFVDEPIDAALKKLSQKGGFTFSYNPSLLPPAKVVSFEFVNKTVRQILDQLFAGTVQYKQRGKYLILTRSELSEDKDGIYSGYIIDETTGERLRNVSVYDPVTLSSAVTDSYGYFEIRIDEPSTDLKLAVKRFDYTDTLVVASSKRLMNIPIRVNTKKVGVFADSVGEKIKRFWKTKVLLSHQVNMLNIQDTLYRDTQFSFVPFIGTNHALSGNVINKVSFNMLGGYSLGTRAAEFGGIFNIDRGDVRSWQVAGVFNLDGGDVEGFQFAGFFNANRGTTRGAQFAGVSNFDWGEVAGFSGAGIVNIFMNGSRAFQVGGIGNVTLGEQTRPQFAGVFNMATGKARSQLGGIFNMAAKNMDGAQLAGIFNLTGKSVKGTQVAGIFNFAGKNVDGAQVSGIFNFAKKVNGTQVGLINVSDSVGGVPVGLMSVVFKGYHKIEIAADEIFYTNLSFRTGVRQFYNILTVGAKPASLGSNETFWTFGYGIGTAPKLSPSLFLNLDLTSNQLVQGNSIEAINLINRFYFGIDIQIMKKASLAFGATVNAQVTDVTYEGYWETFTDYKPGIFYNRTHDDKINTRMWLGGKIGLRFF
jgi:hypothetical protein